MGAPLDAMFMPDTRIPTGFYVCRHSYYIITHGIVVVDHESVAGAWEDEWLPSVEDSGIIFHHSGVWRETIVPDEVVNMPLNTPKGNIGLN
jgi:hypothetical protein